MENLNNSTIIRNISFDQKEILYNIMTLHNNGKAFDCDMTASALKFYDKNIDKNKPNQIPIPKILFDVYPQSEDIIKIEPFKPLPLADNSIHSIVIDLPFCISPHNAPSVLNPKNGSNIIQKRFSSWYPANEGYENMYWWLSESNRVIDDGGIIIYKMQSTVSGGKQHQFTPFSFIVAQSLGLYVLDEFILEAKARLISSSKYKAQQHARRYTSTFWVFKKDSKKGKGTNCFDILEECKNKFNINNL